MYITGVLEHLPGATAEHTYGDIRDISVMDWNIGGCGSDMGNRRGQYMDLILCYGRMVVEL